MRKPRVRYSRHALNRQFDQKWVLIRNPVYDDDNRLILAEVVAHSKYKDYVCKKMPKKKSRVEYQVIFAEAPKPDPNVILWVTPFFLNGLFDSENVFKRHDLDSRRKSKKGKST